MPEATLYRSSAPATVVWTAIATQTAGELLQVPDGRAGIIAGLENIAIGESAVAIVEGQFTLAKGTSLVILKGAPLYWDRSANTVTPLKAVAGADFFVGVAVADAIAAATTVVVDLNVEPVYLIDLLRDPSLDVASGSASLALKGGAIEFTMDATSEVQKIDALSIASIPVTVPFIVEGRMAIWSVGSAAAVDMNVGIASATHATDAGAIAESVFVHFNNALDIFLESDDGTTEVAETNSTIDAVDDTYFDFAFDCRDLTDIQIYINGVLMLGATVFALGGATGPLMLLAHMEKTTGTATGVFRVAKLALRAMDITA